MFKDKVNIISYKADGHTKDGFKCVLLELMDQTLKERLDEQKKTGELLDEFKVWFYFIQIIRGVAWLNYYKIIHLDLKADNILIKRENGIPVVKISDFGNSKIVDAEKGEDQYVSEGVATFKTMPPEMILGKKFGTRADSWALGCLLYQLCTLDHPFGS